MQMEFSVTLTPDGRVRLRVRINETRWITTTIPNWEWFCSMLDSLNNFRNKVEAMKFAQKAPKALTEFVQTLHSIDKVGG